MASKPKTKGEQKPAIDAAEKVAPATNNNDSEKTPSDDRPWLFKPGQIPNPKGRPKGSKNKLSESFISALSDDFEQHGVAVIQEVRLEKPAEYLKIIAAIVPKEFTVNTVTTADMSDDELIERLDQVRSIAAALAGASAGQGTGISSGKTKPH